MDIEDLHREAIEKGESMYIDPSTGYKVFTSAELSKRKCCGNICRHCPYGHIKGSKNKMMGIDK
jgi:hypothetical protein